METTSCIVIGGGPAGLLAALRVARAGVPVTLLEARATLGGRAATLTRAGFSLNHGPHALYAGGAGLRELRAVGIDPPCWTPVSATASVLSRDGRARRGAGGARTHLALARWLVAVLRDPEPERLAGVSAADWLAESLSDAGARAAAEGLVRVATYTGDLGALSADVAAAQVRLAVTPGVRYVRGGWQTIVDALAARARTAGATVAVRSAVRSVTADGASWVVHTDDAEHPAGTVVLATGGPEAARSLLGSAVLAPGPPAEVSCLDVGLDRLPHPRRRFAFGTDAPVYLSRHSPPDHPGGTLLTVASYERRSRPGLEAVLDQLQPGWRERLVMEPRHLPRMVAVSALATPATGGRAGRPGPELPGHPGLLLAGDWVGPEGWLLDAALSSAGAAALVALARTTAPRAA